MTSNDYSILSHTQTTSSTFSSPRAPHSCTMMPSDSIVHLRAHSAPPLTFQVGSAPTAPPPSSPVPQWFIRTTFSASSTPISSLQELPQEQTEHIPRPPNAFMLYRSDFLKKRTIPEEVEKRQQNLSRIAGQCWKMLSAEERAIWNDKAAAVAAAHHAKYPDYKFRPIRKGARKHVGKKTDKSFKSGGSKGGSSGGLHTGTEVLESSVGPARRSRIARRYVRQSPYDESISTPLQPPTASSITVSPSASPLSLNPLLCPLTSLDGSSSAAVFDDNASQMQVPHCQDILGLEQTLSQYSSIFSSGKTLSEMVQDLSVTHVSENNIGFLYERNPASFGGEKNQMSHALYPDYTPSSSGFIASTLTGREDGIDRLEANSDYSSDKLGSYHSSLLSWSPDGVDRSGAA